MPSQYGAKLWAKKETKRLARRSAEIVKGAVAITMPTPVLRNSNVNMEDIIPLDLQKGMSMLKVSEKKERQLFFRIDPDEGAILYKSSKDVTGASNGRSALITVAAGLKHLPSPLQSPSRASKSCESVQTQATTATSSSFQRSTKNVG